MFDELSALCLAHGIAQELLWAVPLRGRALVELGDIARGLEELEGGLEAHLITRSTLLRPYYFVLYAGALLRARRFDRASRRSWKRVRWPTRPTSTRTTRSSGGSQRKCASRAGTIGVARRCIARRWQIARAQGARCARTARLARLRVVSRSAPAAAAEARDVLQVCDWFTEGRSTHGFRVRRGAAAARLERRLTGATGCIESTPFGLCFLPSSRSPASGVDLFLRHERILVVARRRERFLDRARADPADQVQLRARLVVGARRRARRRTAAGRRPRRSACR